MPLSAFFLPILGLVVGFSSGLLGIGGGVVIVPALLLLFGVEMHSALAISLTVIIPTALVGVLRYGSLGHGDLRVAVLIAAGAMVGAYIGATLSATLPAETLKRIFGILLLAVGAQLLIGK